VNTSSDHPLKIGAVASAAGVNVQTVRFYERVRLIPKPARTEGGFRLYSSGMIRRLRFIKQAQALGFSLEEVRELMALEERPATTCRDVRERLQGKVATVDAMIRKLGRLRTALVAMSRRCPGDSSAKAACPLLESLTSEES
jgi:MerR family mercuric resistance operon transcriptional regulator